MYDQKSGNSLFAFIITTRTLTNYFRLTTLRVFSSLVKNRVLCNGHTLGVWDLYIKAYRPLAFMSRIWHLAKAYPLHNNIANTIHQKYSNSMVAIMFYVFIFLLTLLSYTLMKRNNREPPQKGAKLPPGSMGWPYIGETLQLYSQDPNSFFASKQKRSLSSLSLLY